MTVSDILILVWMHFLSDFILQSDYVAKNKSKSNAVLLQHVVIYSIPFLYFGVLFALINTMLHFVVDYFTSRATSKLWANGKVHYFFVVIGFDQALHLTSLIGTMYFLSNI